MSWNSSWFFRMISNFSKIQKYMLHDSIWFKKQACGELFSSFLNNVVFGERVQVGYDIYSSNHFDPCYGWFRFIPRGMNIKSSFWRWCYSSHQSCLSRICMNINVASPPVWSADSVHDTLLHIHTRERCCWSCNTLFWSLSGMKCLFVWQLTLWHATSLLCNHIWFIRPLSSTVFCCLQCWPALRSTSIGCLGIPYGAVEVCNDT